MKQAYVFLADGFEEVEALTVVDLLRRAGVEVTTVSIKEDRQVTGTHLIPVTADAVISDIREKTVDLIVLPGGMPGTKYLSESKEVLALVEEQIKAEKLVSAICAAPALVLGDKGYLAGHKATCYPGMDAYITNGGGTHLTDPVVCDGQFVTSRGVGTAIPFGLALIEKLCGEAKSKEIAESIVFAI